MGFQRAHRFPQKYVWSKHETYTLYTVLTLTFLMTKWHFLVNAVRWSSGNTWRNQQHTHRGLTKGLKQRSAHCLYPCHHWRLNSQKSTEKLQNVWLFNCLDFFLPWLCISLARKQCVLSAVTSPTAAFVSWTAEHRSHLPPSSRYCCPFWSNDRNTEGRNLTSLKMDTIY